MCGVSAGATTELPSAGARLEVELVLDERAWFPGAVLSAVSRRGWWIVTVA